MHYRPFGQSGIDVSELSLGAMSLGSMGNADHGECVRIIHAALDQGVNCIDTADMYSQGESEEIVGLAIAGRRERVVVSSKCFWPMSDDPNDRGLSRRWITSAVEGSLRRLSTDYLDILFLHKPDDDTDLSESLEAASDLVRRGQVRFIGTSSYPARRLVESQWISVRRRLEAAIFEQPSYSLFVRGIEVDVLPLCRKYDIGVMAASPLNGGWLTGGRQGERTMAPGERQTQRWDNDSQRMNRSPSRQKVGLVVSLTVVAAESSRSLVGLSLAFVLEHPAISTAVVGPRTMTQLHDFLSASRVPLDRSTLDRLDEIVPPGVDVDASDRWYRPPGLKREHRRRMHPESISA